MERGHMRTGSFSLDRFTKQIVFLINNIYIATCLQQTEYRFEPGKESECRKMNLNETWRPIEVPPDAEYFGARYIGAKEYSLGLEVDLWGGDTSQGYTLSCINIASNIVFILHLYLSF